MRFIAVLILVAFIPTFTHAGDEREDFKQYDRSYSENDSTPPATSNRKACMFALVVGVGVGTLFFGPRVANNFGANLPDPITWLENQFAEDGGPERHAPAFLDEQIVKPLVHAKADIKLSITSKNQIIIEGKGIQKGRGRLVLPRAFTKKPTKEINAQTSITTYTVEVTNAWTPGSTTNGILRIFVDKNGGLVSLDLNEKEHHVSTHGAGADRFSQTSEIRHELIIDDTGIKLDRHSAKHSNNFKGIEIPVN